MKESQKMYDPGQLCIVHDARLGPVPTCVDPKTGLIVKVKKLHADTRSYSVWYDVLIEGKVLHDVAAFYCKDLDGEQQ